jgi:hypothetical protein
LVFTAEPPKVTPTDAPAANPVPVTVTWLPAAPNAGERKIRLATAKVAVAVCAVSETDTVSEPHGTDGTRNVHSPLRGPGKFPLESVEHVDGTALPPTVKLIAVSGSNPFALAATTVPTSPVLGERVSPGEAPVVTVNATVGDEA